MHLLLKRLSGDISPPGKCEDDSQLNRNKEALEAAKVSVYKEQRPRICLVCVANKTLPFEQQIHKFYTSGDLSKHFKREHLANVRDGDRFGCRLCKVGLNIKMHYQRHAYEVHGTVST